MLFITDNPGIVLSVHNRCQTDTDRENETRHWSKPASNATELKTLMRINVKNWQQTVPQQSVHGQTNQCV